ncbi:ParM/StbA family protein [Desulfofalx alkaliphila]|uniref:ParM/StbA family protein n=1 Tax=Desulfofalx alkaliphila TaxID=105483 RepID=UPI0004E278CF|nr:ParM/StbA family protein [Desulfofalx alkaliphila]
MSIFVTPVGLDSGYSYMKAIACGRAPVVFANMVSPGREVTEDGLEEVLGQAAPIKNIDISFTHNGKKHYWVGKMATSSGNDADYFEDKDRWNSEKGRATALAALALLCHNDHESFVLATGLPLEDYKANKTSLKKTYEHTIPGAYEVTFESGPLTGETRRFNIVAAKVYPQGMGVFFDQLLTEDGEQIDSHPLLEDGAVCGLIDVGRRTTNLCLFDDFTLSKDFSCSINYGISMVHEKLQNFLSKHGRFVKNRDIEAILKKDTFKGLDVKTPREKALQELAEIIVSEAENRWADKSLLENIYVGGGGGQAVFQFLNFKEYQKNMVNEPQLSNARGFLKAILSLTLAGRVQNRNGEYIENIEVAD